MVCGRQMAVEVLVHIDIRIRACMKLLVLEHTLIALSQNAGAGTLVLVVWPGCGAGWNVGVGDGAKTLEPECWYAAP